MFYRRLAEVAGEFLKKGSKLDIFKKPVHVVPMWNAALGRSVETVWPSIMEIQTTASRTGLWAGMDRPVWGPDVTHTFTGRFKDDNDAWQENTVTVTFPEWVAVTVYRLVGGRRWPSLKKCTGWEPTAPQVVKTRSYRPPCGSNVRKASYECHRSILKRIPCHIDWHRYDSPTVLRRHGRGFLERSWKAGSPGK